MTHFSHGLTVGLVASSKAIWRWQFHLIQSLVGWGVISVQEVIVLERPEFQVDKSIELLHCLDGKIFSSPVSAFELEDVSHLSKEVVSYNEIFLGEKRTFDLLINLSETVVPNLLVQGAFHGVVSPRFSEAGELCSQSLGIEQYLNNQQQVFLSIVHQDIDGYEYVLGQISPSFDEGSLSRNLSQYWVWFSHLWKRSLDELSTGRGRVLHLKSSKGASSEDCKSNDVFSLPKVVKGLAQLSHHVTKKLKQKYFHQEQWVLLIKHLKTSSSNDIGKLNFSSYTEISPPDDCFWADPFVFSKGGHNYVFFEELPFASERGHLSCMEVFDDGSCSEAKVIIQEPHHLSYPNIFTYDSDYYMVPESGDKGSIDLYRCTDFPYQWKYQTTLINDIHAYDSTLIEHQGRWWLFATVVPELGLSGCEELHIFYASSPISTEWQPHMKNPVISDASCARPGGNFYVKESQIYRVSQDCAGRYGAGININKVVRLDIEDYEEISDSSHYPDWDENLVALHTFNFNGNIAVADVLRVKTKDFIR